MADVPEELVEEILLRLPMKSLLRFKTFSKKWYSLISKDHDFAKAHVKRSSKNLIIYDIVNGCEDLFQYSDVDSNASRTIKFPVEKANPCQIIGSANGLICIVPLQAMSCCYMWNPCTGEYRRITVPKVVQALGILLGFGYDPVSDDYKILGIWHSDSGSDTDEYCDSHLQIFSSRKNSWKKLGVEFASGHISTTPAFYLNGALHWSYFGPLHSQIAGFDLAGEEFYFLDLPKRIDFGRSWVRLFDYQGCLCVSRRNSIWVMKEYGNSKSWAKLTAISLPEEYAKPVGIFGVGEVVFRTRGGLGFVKSDIEGRIYDEYKLQISDEDAFIYKESLISPKHVIKRKRLLKRNKSSNAGFNSSCLNLIVDTSMTS